MKGLCKTECGMTVEYVPHEFSDGFVYYLPRNLDGTVHNCIFSEEEPDFFDIEADGWEDFCEKHKERLKINPDDLREILDTREGMWLEPMDLNFMDTVREGNGFVLKKVVEEELTNSPLPTFAHRSDYRWGVQRDDIELPTVHGYQLEFLGYLYEMMIRLEDAKKCFELQYECTGEPELKERVEELNKKIQERKNVQVVEENIPVDLTPEDVQKRIDFTELNIKKYTVELFSNNFTEFFKKNPKLKEQCERDRRKREDMLLDFNENSAIDTLNIGSVAHILKISRGKKRSESNGTCKICKRGWKEKEEIFSENIPKEINCVDDTCFAKQGGLAKKTPMELVYNILSMKNTRNILAHPDDYDQEMFKKILRQTYATCDVINYYIERILKNKEST